MDVEEQQISTLLVDIKGSLDLPEKVLQQCVSMPSTAPLLAVVDIVAWLVVAVVVALPKPFEVPGHGAAKFVAPNRALGY